MMITSPEITTPGQEWRDAKRALWLLTPGLYILPFLYMAGYFVTGHIAWVFAPLIYTFIFVPLLDTIFGEDPNNPPEEVVPALSADPYYRYVAWLCVPGAYAIYIAGLWFAVTQVPLWAGFVFMAGIGYLNGTANNIGHELGHKTGRFDALMARIMLTLIGNGHFVIEHNRGHHTRVSTPEDCSSARYNETLYAFALRDIPGAISGAWALEKRRLQNKSLPIFSHHNQILVSWSGTAAIAAIMTLWLGWWALAFTLLHNFLALFALTLANYIEHYGLRRQKKENGRYEPCQPHHSWNTNHIVSNLMLVQLQRHSDHHANPMRPYQALRNFDNLPTLPSGYPGCFGLAMIPPLWFKVMNPKVQKWADQWVDGDMTRVNNGPT